MIQSINNEAVFVDGCVCVRFIKRRQQETNHHAPFSEVGLNKRERMTEQNRSRRLGPVEGEKDEKCVEIDWSHLPGHFLWGVMNHLNSFDAMRIPHVCSHWRSLIKPETDKPLVPWVLCHPSADSPDHAKLTFIDLSTRGISTIMIPDVLSRASCVSSKHGWLLMHPNLPPIFGPRRRDRRRLHQRDQLPFVQLRQATTSRSTWEPSGRANNTTGNLDMLSCTLRLFHPVTGSFIELPEIQDDIKCAVVGPAIIAAASKTNGKPQLIIQASYQRQAGIVLRITRPGDNTWEKHTFEHCIGWVPIVARLVMHGSTRVLCFDPTGNMCAFDMSDQSWLTFPDLCNSRPGFILESEDEIVKVCALPPSPEHPLSNRCSFMFYKLGMDENGMLAWVELERSAQENRWWFLDRSGQSISVRGVGRKVFEFSEHYKRVENTMPLSVVDLADGIPNELIPELALHNCRLGWIQMVPPVVSA
ncbi:hypothetical protein J5N97_017325 [Dioscorea zingiberensis]|uniref:KIB1-4 beta-propeller domain-containing protein n=1 Tax=Dioscorea zingiberensis TaxID=325984 RepID=A0A9D5HGA0_9LILI|nr:hypothetical protein J5N97_017325 [Dioscorea zingiberensis]